MIRIHTYLNQYAFKNSKKHLMEERRPLEKGEVEEDRKTSVQYAGRKVSINNAMPITLGSFFLPYLVNLNIQTLEGNLVY